MEVAKDRDEVNVNMTAWKEGGGTLEGRDSAHGTVYEQNEWTKNFDTVPTILHNPTRMQRRRFLQFYSKRSRGK